MLCEPANDLRRRRIFEVELDEPGEPAAQILVQRGFDHRPQLAWGDHHELIERPTSVGAQEQLGEMSRMLIDVLFDWAGAAGPRTVSRRMPAMQLVVQSHELDEHAWSAPEQSPGAPAKYRDSPVPTGEHARQRLKPRQRVEDRHRLDGAGQLHRLQSRTAGRGEHRKTPGSVCELSLSEAPGVGG